MERRAEHTHSRIQRAVALQLGIAQRDASCPGKALRRLSGDLGDEVEVLVEM